MQTKKRLLLLAFSITLLLLSIGFTVKKASALFENRVNIYFFWGDGCPHCAKAEPFLKGLAEKYPGVTIQDYEVWYHPENQTTWADMAAKFNIDPSGVPQIFIGDRYWAGYYEGFDPEIEAQVVKCLNEGCVDAGMGVITPSEETNQPGLPVDPQKHTLQVPLIGSISLDSQSLTLSTLLISFVDGFNPCSLWVLSMLMALVIHTGSRKKVLLIGLIFLTVTAAVYAIFIAGLFSVLSVVSYLGWVQAAVAAVALIFALINVKDYFWYKEGVSFTISDEQKPGIYQRMRRVLAAGDNFWALTGATVVLAGGVSLVEFSCTAGFPVLWTNLLTAQNVSATTFVLLLLLYLFIYQIDELAIFGSVVFTLKATRLEEKQGRILKLVGGMLMLTLAAVMLVKPSLMNNIGSSVLIFGSAFAAALLVLLLHRRILPHYGIWIGTEEQGKNRRRASRRAARRHAKAR